MSCCSFHERQLVNWIVATAKIFIPIHRRFNKNIGTGTNCAVTLCKAKLISRVNIEFQFAKLHGSVYEFGKKWYINNSNWKIENDEVRFHFQVRFSNV